MVPSSWAVITLILWSFTLLHHQVEIYICMCFQKPNSSTVWSFKYAWALRSIGEPSLGCQIREVACAGLPESGIWCPFHEAKVLSCSFASSKPCLATTSGLIRFHTHEHADICAFKLLHTLIPSCSHFSVCVTNFHCFATCTHNSSWQWSRVSIILIPNHHWIIYANES